MMMILMIRCRTLIHRQGCRQGLVKGQWERPIRGPIGIVGTVHWTLSRNTLTNNKDAIGRASPTLRNSDSQRETKRITSSVVLVTKGYCLYLRLNWYKSLYVHNYCYTRKYNVPRSSLLLICIQERYGYRIKILTPFSSGSNTRTHSKYGQHNNKSTHHAQHKGRKYLPCLRLREHIREVPIAFGLQRVNDLSCCCLSSQVVRDRNMLLLQQ